MKLFLASIFIFSNLYAAPEILCRSASISKQIAISIDLPEISDGGGWGMPSIMSVAVGSKKTKMEVQVQGAYTLPHEKDAPLYSIEVQSAVYDGYNNILIQARNDYGSYDETITYVGNLTLKDEKIGLDGSPIEIQCQIIGE